MTPEAANTINNAAAAGMTMVLFALSLFIMWLYALVDTIRSEFTNQNNKTTWILLLLFVAPIAAILYPFISRNQKIKYSEPYRRGAKEVESARVARTGHESKKKDNKNDNWF